VPESILADIIATWELELPGTIKLAYLPSEGRVRLRLSTRGKDKELLNSTIDEQIEKLKLIIPKLIFGEENDTLEQRIGQELLRVNASVGSAESCTGGYVAHLITQVSGASAYFKGSVLAYNAAVKQTVLGVRAKTIADFGVVSKQVAEEMALGVQQLMKVDYAIATTGIAGPLGGTIDNPVGTIWTSVATPNGVQSVKHQLGTERVRNIKRSSTAVLLDLLHILERVDKKGE
jgi:nicotinamide-nucleotide amidase